MGILLSGGASSYQAFAFGNSLTSTQANCGFKLGRTCKVGSYHSNGFRLCEMHGNVWEWCADWYDSNYYRNSPRQDPTGPSGGSDRVYRGGGWFIDPRYCRSAHRYWNRPGSRSDYLGCRLALVVLPSGN